jgi:homoserine dehydrogenase
MDIGRRILAGSSPIAIGPSDAGAPIQIQPIENIRALYYVRFMVFDRPGVLSEISGIFGRYNISIASVIQRGREEGSAVPLVFMTHTALERDMAKALVEIKRLACISEEPVLIRVEGEEQ